MITEAHFRIESPHYLDPRHYPTEALAVQVAKVRGLQSQVALVQVLPTGPKSTVIWPDPREVPGFAASCCGC